ncbi:SusC/RagA family TonB-linked outer membrane protein [Maribacter flavus]|uniref:TonB-dependent receptor plug domain-containing protein n=1 Tax=Maribacter flavus TaxID=1658664 RepID=A0A5B2TXI6_9FLAO|nr:TonB-dependent receptor plug domain-containing protein [Maribacter flavus]KAA2219044.1 TonB-dependent receptor plug domain-containing protein [Maribacter flavus]
MKHTVILLFCSILIVIISCGTSKNSSSTNYSNETISSERTDIPLLDRIRKKSGIIIRNGVPLLNKAANSFNSEGSPEPLYIVNSQILGNSFYSVNDLVDSFNVKSIRILSGPDTSSYGTQGANGVIIITIFQ